MSISSQAPPNEVAVQLLDSVSGRVLKTWRFKERSEVTIGRSSECDVEINDPYVSRLHAQLMKQDGQWQVVSRGRHGVLVRNEPIQEMLLGADTIFQLGPTGPMLRFGSLQKDEQDSRRTLYFEADPLPAFTLDAEKLDEEVGQIAQGDYFQRLQEQAKSLRSDRHKHA